MKLGSFMSHCSAMTAKKCKKKTVMHVQSCCFAHLNPSRFFLSFSLLSPSSLLNLGLIVVIQKFGYHGNLTSHFFSLFVKNVTLHAE